MTDIEEDSPRKLSEKELQQRCITSSHFKALMESYWRYVESKDKSTSD